MSKVKKFVVVAKETGIVVGEFMDDNIEAGLGWFDKFYDERYELYVRLR